MKGSPADGERMPTHLVNLDALIKREDFESSTGDLSPKSRRLGAELKLEDLERTYFHLLRKPDFQRATTNWGPDKVVEFVKSFLDGDLIPSVIMWWSSLSGTVFVIDGAHRISALMAWVHDDYGDGRISGPFFGHDVPAAQKRFARTAKQLIEQQIGAYQRLKYVLQNPSESPDPIMLRRARNLGTFKIDLQWVEGNAETAEGSFFRINGSASIIDHTELEIIKARRKPNAIATRALMHAGTGHKYWSAFPKDVIGEIETLSRDIYEALFKPILESPIKTVDLPIAGQGYSADTFKMILDLVNLVNDVSPAMWRQREPRGKRKEDTIPILADDIDGLATVKFLKGVRDAARLISGTYAGSLGLHPVVYFYGANGRFQPAAFLATVKFVRELRAGDMFEKFTDVRHDFEEFLVRHRHFVSAIGHGYGSRTRPLEALVTMYNMILTEIREGRTSDEAIRTRLLSEPKLKELRSATEDSDKQYRKGFSRDEKSAAYLRDAIDRPVRCKICEARLHFRSISMDHTVRVQDGGMGNPENAQSTHFYCNTGYKESRHSKAIKDARSSS